MHCTTYIFKKLTLLGTINTSRHLPFRVSCSVPKIRRIDVITTSAFCQKKGILARSSNINSALKFYIRTEYEQLNYINMSVREFRNKSSRWLIPNLGTSTRVKRDNSRKFVESINFCIFFISQYVLNGIEI